MAWWNEQLRRVRHLFGRERFDDDMAEEMRLHLDLRAAEHPEAEREARIRFGNVTRVKEDSRSAWGWPFLESLVQDVRYGVRSLAADRAFTVTAVVSLVLGIGANTAIFSIVNAVMLRSLPVQDPSGLVQVQIGKSSSVTNPLWEALRDQQQAFSGTLAVASNRFDLTEGGESQYASGLWVSGSFFQVLGVPAMRGRVLTNDDDQHGGGKAGPVAVISYAFWKSRYNADPDIVGKVIKLDRKSLEIVGVTPPWFTGLDNDVHFDVAIPIGCEPIFHTDRSALSQRSWWWLQIVGRLQPGENMQQAQSRMNAIAPDIMRATVPPWNPEQQKDYLSRTLDLKPIASGFSGTGRQYRTALFTLMALVGVVLLIACANVANLLLARATARQRELTVRLAIGAGRARIIRQLLTESFLLAIAGAAGGLALAIWGSKLLVHFLSTRDAELQIDTSLDLTAAAFISGIVLLTTFLFGLAPALSGASTAPSDVLKENARGTVRGGGRFTLGRALVTLQVAMSLMLLLGAVLFDETFRRLVRVDVGFERQSVEIISASVPQSQVPKAQRIALFDRVLERLRTVPGVQSASQSRMTPIGHWFWNDDVEPEGYQKKSSNQEELLVYFNRVSTDYMKTLGTPILAGRDFSSLDSMTSPKVMMISELAARQFWGSANPIGKTIRLAQSGPDRKPETYQVIGLVKDIKYGELQEKTLKTGYFTTHQDAEPDPETRFELHLNQPPAQVLPVVRAAIAEVDKSISIEMHSLEQQVADSLIRPRLVAVLSSFFGAAALILAATGLYGIIAYTIARRRCEIGLRMALGARYGSVLWLVLRDVLVMVVLGGAVGLIASHFATRLVESLLFGVKPTDPAILFGAVAVLFTAAAIAAYVPARRAARMDPMDALRSE